MMSPVRSALVWVWAWALMLAPVIALGAGCRRAPTPERPRARRAGPPANPRVRISRVLRLKRAGILQWVTQGPVRGVAALVPPHHRSGGWQRAVDSQHNQYGVTPGGVIVADGEPHADREPASVANVAYYYAQAHALMAARYRRQGLLMATEILDLPGDDASVKLAQRSLCALLSKLGITGDIRKRLYHNLVGVAHRVAAGARVTNHVHGFAITVPLPWRALAGSAPKLGHDTTIMVFAVPPPPPPGTETSASTSASTAAQANLLWSTRRLKPGTDLARHARMHLLTTAGSRIRTSAFKPPSAAVGTAIAYEVDPVKHKGRHLTSLQLFFTTHDRVGVGVRVHHLNLLVAKAAQKTTLRQAFHRVLTSFRAAPPRNPCATR